MTKIKPQPDSIIQKLRAANLRPTRQRVMIANLLFDGHDKHISPEMLFETITKSGETIALGTIYNTLRHFADAGLLSQHYGLGDKLVYDTNISAHHHFLDSDTGELTDVPHGDLAVSGLPNLPDGFDLDAVDVTIRIKRSR